MHVAKKMLVPSSFSTVSLILEKWQQHVWQPQVNSVNQQKTDQLYFIINNIFFKKEKLTSQNSNIDTVSAVTIFYFFIHIPLLHRYD